MKKTFLLLLALCMTSVMFAENFVMIKVKNQQNLQELFNRQDINIHYYNDNFVLASAENMSDDMILLDENSFASNENYFIIYCNKDEQSNYVSREKNNAEILYSNSDIMIVKPLNTELKPAKNDGMVAISNKTAKLPIATRDFPTVTEEDEFIKGLMEQVSIDNLTASVEYLQSYESRYYNSDYAYEAANWIQEQFDNTSILETEQFPFTYQGNQCAPNIIATQWGTKYPDEFIVCGSHLDSYSYSGVCPGADDNATGVATVIETARILSQHNFERSIIFCAFGAEEIGLIGSDAYAEYCADMGMNIVAYFNNDMNGYLNPGDDIHIDLIYPNAVETLGNYYMNVANVYFPEMQVRHVNFTAGDSDHTSFNQNGFMGIFPFEDYENYSPYIHGANDLIGPSVNSFEMSQRFTQMNLACIATLAGLDTESVSENMINTVELFPNPANNQLTLTNIYEGISEVQIINSVGQIVKEFSFESTTTIDISDLNSGVYVVKVLGDNNVTKKLVVNN
ncbi:MAG: M20/M25/M40 family metallo-hydrolase [Bacteroidales bacterium]|nr:M20/M25/M40 family metallo-hydrolase [Bacteroidales bacterium]